MSLDVVVVDLGVGNLGNVERALVAAGGAPRRTSDPEEVRKAERIVLPGVGAFRPPRERLRGEIEAAVRDAVETGSSLFGICVGFQLLFEASEEFGVTDGLGYFGGRVRQLPDEAPRPHIGWNRLRLPIAHPLTEGIDDGAFFYFVHSFAPDEVGDAAIALTSHGRTFVSAAAKRRIGGVQFHPEKSGDAGVRVLTNFLNFRYDEPLEW